ncbi:hypothetical protein MMC25_007675 [Agyrium rufum]|nr:hypothetical protein [Agyrium rufum]
MSAKHFINDPLAGVLASLRSLTLTNPSLCLDEANKIIYRHPDSLGHPETKISVICGGGSGHEPAFPGYVGRGLLTACVAGTIFASPAAEQIRTCLAHRLPSQSKGTIVVIMNYTGDVLNFGMGVEKARALGKKVEILIVADDVGVGRAKGGKVGRRGIAGAALVVKIVGALAEMGVDMEETLRIGRLAADNVVSIAASLGRTHVPGKASEDAAEELERLPFGSVEIGMGIHNEPGCEKIEADLPGIVQKMLAQLLDQNDKDRAYVKIDKKDPVVMLINNFGGLSNLELGAITTEVWTQLKNDYGLQPLRIITGVINGSLNGLGFGISIMKMVDIGSSVEVTLLDLIDAPTEAIGWPAPIKKETWEKQYQPVDEKASSSDDTEEAKPSKLRLDPAILKEVLTKALNRTIAAEADVTKFDTIVGDGDCGLGLKRGAEALLKMLERTRLTDDFLVTFSTIVNVIENTMDGTSGALYVIFLNAVAHNLRTQDTSSSPVEMTSQIWANALESSLQNIGRYTPAQPGDRTLMDALYPFVTTLKEGGDVKAAGQKATEGAESTRGMRASLGRTVYVGGDGWQGVPDPGAYGLAEFLGGIVDAL